ncbi:MAG: glycosyltransferase [Elusimicrobia bacterium]|nr:glycosyltransferase [Elusimicrobiota bacterium]
MPVKTLVVLPSFRESARLPGVFREIRSLVAPPGHQVSFLLVDDGSGEEECRRLAALIEEHGLASRMALLSLGRNQGKGAAILAGFKRGLAEGHDYLAFMDSDGAIPVAELYRAVRYAASANEVSAVIGARVKMLGRNVARSYSRHYIGRVFATFVSAYFQVPVYDSQCGLKIIRRDVLERYLDVPTDKRWVWDTELLLAMLAGGERVHELPIDWKEIAGSKISPLRDSLRMVFRLVAFKPRLKIVRPR